MTAKLFIGALKMKKEKNKKKENEKDNSTNLKKDMAILPLA